MAKIHQVLAVEKGIKSEVHAHVSKLYKFAQKPTLFTGQHRSYSPKEDGGEEFPPERNAVQLKASDLVAGFIAAKSDLFNIVAQKDMSNESADADLVVDGQTLIARAPVSYLLFLEKELTDFKTFIEALPELDGAEHWTFDAENGIYKSDVTRTHRTQKNVKPIVKYPATPEHPAQTEMVVQDETVGYWYTTKMSGGMPKTKKEAILLKVRKLILAVKDARERANSTAAVEKPDYADSIFTYLVE